MNKDEALDLLNKISIECSIKGSKIGINAFISPPSPIKYDAEAEGYTIGVSRSIIPDSSIGCVRRIVKNNKKKIMKTIHHSEEIHLIYTPRKS